MTHYHHKGNVFIFLFAGIYLHCPVLLALD